MKLQGKRKQKTNFKTLMTLTAGFSILTMILSLPEVHAYQGNDQKSAVKQNKRGGSGKVNTSSRHGKNWDRNYIGQRNFKLNDDQRLSRLQGQANKATKTFNEAKRQFDVVNNQLTKLQGQLASLQKEKKQLNNQIQKTQGQIDKKSANKQQKENSIPAKEQKVEQAKSNKQNAKRNKDQKDRELTAAQKKRDAIVSACNAAPTPQCQQQKKAANQDVKAKKQAQTQAANRLKAANQGLAAAQKDLKQTRAQIAKLGNEIQTLKTQKQSLTQKRNQKNQQVENKKTQVASKREELKPYAQRKKQANQNKNQKITQKDNYRDQLIDRILAINKEGAQEGRIDGRADGQDLARERGNSFGRADGSEDGRYKGTQDGERRDYNLGFDAGENDGIDQGAIDGEAKGSRNGTISGNQIAAKNKARIDGQARAEASDAAQVGQNQGQAAGLARAERTGNINGTKIGERQAIEAFENVQLSNQSAQGPFATAFARSVPGFPQGYQGNRFNPRNNFKREVVKKAFKNGYRFRYRRAIRSNYDLNIGSIYDNAYRANFDITYRDYYSQSYPASRQAGYDRGYSEGYDREYSVAYSRFFDEFQRKFANNPDTNSSEYKSTYARVEQETYDAEYEVIRLANFEAKEQSTYDANIAAQTEKFRAQRYAQVESIYKNNPVLKYVSSQTVDGGISGVAAKDGVYQPTETVFHNVTVTNFGEKAATNVKVTVDNKEFVVSTIPAKATTTIKGAAKSEITENAGETDSKSLRMFSTLSAEAKIQGRHYADLASAQVNNTDRKRLSVKFPFSLSNMATKSVVVMNELNGLSVNINNLSERKYTGPIDITLTVSSQNDVVTKNFKQVMSLRDTARLTDSELLITKEDDVYRPIEVSAKVSKNGVTLGYLNQSLVFMSKAPYLEKSGAPVVIANSNIETKDLLDVIDQFGGMSNLSVLDLALANKSANASALRGLNNKTAMVVETGTGQVVNSLKSIIKNSVNSSIVTIDSNRSGYTLLRKAPQFYHASELPLKVTGIGLATSLFANQHRVKGLDKSFPVVSAVFSDLIPVVQFADKLRQSPADLLAQVTSNITAANYFNAPIDSALTMEAFNARAIAELDNLNVAYKESGGWFKRDKKFYRAVEDDDSLYINQLKLAVKRPRNAAFGLVLFATNASETWKDAYKNFDPIDDDMTSKVKGKAENVYDDISDPVKDYLKSANRGIYDKAYDNENIYTPFDVEGESSRRTGPRR